MATSIINYPEVAILGVHRIIRRPAVVPRQGGETIEIRDLMNLSLSFDHRVVDGYDAARFVADIKATLETPGRALPRVPPDPMAGRPRTTKELPRIRAGMGDVAAEAIEAWRDDDYQRATGLADPATEGRRSRARRPRARERLRDALGTMLFARALGALTVARAGAESPEGRLEAADPRGRRSGHRRACWRRWRSTTWSCRAAPSWQRPSAGVPGRLARARRRGLPRRARIPAGRSTSCRAPPSQQSATQLPHAMGIAWAMKMQEKPGVALAVALAFLDASDDQRRGLSRRPELRGRLQGARVIFVCINVVAAVGAAVPETVSETMAVKALAYGIAATRVDGGDLLAVYAATRDAVERARAEATARPSSRRSSRQARWAVGRDRIERPRAWLAARASWTSAAAPPSRPRSTRSRRRPLYSAARVPNRQAMSSDDRLALAGDAAVAPSAIGV